jgi:hypothetical protein
VIAAGIEGEVEREQTRRVVIVGRFAGIGCAKELAKHERKYTSPDR